MILADKIIKLRKQQGWSQEDLAEKLNVSRQSVSKWESTVSIPDMDKILKLSKLFGVSTDYLLMDDKETPEYSEGDSECGTTKLSLQTINEFLALSKDAYKKIALGVMICILSPVVLIGLMGYSEFYPEIIKESHAAAIGVSILLTMVLIAVVIFINESMKLSKYNYLDKEIFELEYGVRGVVEKRNSESDDDFRINLIKAIVIIFVAVVQLVLGALLEVHVLITILQVCALLMMISYAVYLMVRFGMVKESYSKILQVEEFSVQRKSRRKRMDSIESAYWSVVVGVYLLWSFLTMQWHFTWIIWPVAGVLYGAVEAIFSRD